jgi:hypothetical protein
MSAHFDDMKWYSYTSSTQTTRTWVRRVISSDDLPPEFKPVFPVQEKEFPYTLIVPEDKFSLFHKRNSQIVWIDDDQIGSIELMRKGSRTFSSKFEDVLFIERGKVLLHSWLKIVTSTDSLYIRFNSTNERLFIPIIDKIRRGMGGSQNLYPVVDEKNGLELSKFDYLMPIDFKYMNYGRESIRSDDSVISVVYQPDRCIHELKILSKIFFRRYATSHLSIVTEKELILIKENKKTKTEKDCLYGAVFTYIPHRQINEVLFIPNNENSQYNMEIILSENTYLSSEFSNANGEMKLLQEYLLK